MPLEQIRDSTGVKDETICEENLKRKLMRGYVVILNYSLTRTKITRPYALQTVYDSTITHS